jgi:potassium efflux system protein
VLATPAPKALLESFEESAMHFSLRVYHAKISDRLRGLHELNAAIQEAFRQAGITIAFPQRDVHIRQVPPTLTELATTLDVSDDETTGFDPD